MEVEHRRLMRPSCVEGSRTFAAMRQKWYELRVHRRSKWQPRVNMGPQHASGSGISAVGMAV